MNISVSILNRDERDVLTYFINHERLSHFIIFELPHIQHGLEDYQIIECLNFFASINIKINEGRTENNDKTLNYNNHNFDSISWASFELFDDTDIFIELPAKIDLICEFYDEC